MLRTRFFRPIRGATGSLARRHQSTIAHISRPSPIVHQPSRRSPPTLYPRQPARCYSAPTGLTKKEVEGRIMDLLRKFDKVGRLVRRRKTMLISRGQFFMFRSKIQKRYLSYHDHYDSSSHEGVSIHDSHYMGHLDN